MYKSFMQKPGNNYWIKSVSWEYKWDEEYLEEFNKGKILQYS